MMTSNRNPFETLLVAFFGLYCAAGLVAFDRVATTVLRGYPEPWGRIFLGLTLITCVVTLVGIARASTAVGVLIERAGLVGLGGVCGAYTIWAFGSTGLRALAFGLLLAALAASAVWRAWQITRALVVARKA